MKYKVGDVVEFIYEGGFKHKYKYDRCVGEINCIKNKDELLYIVKFESQSKIRASKIRAYYYTDIHEMWLFKTAKSMSHERQLKLDRLHESR